ncbi:MAG TPA: SUMF1/EgtB/PvdO family nonheme iron enzyme [Opitutaceae bacterium]|jgi:formylglycine-generating enzyme required for sulfatase activity|nr:SUMF1/EgtB/PvdO family nonheme iron enzyme [Opitutaceae bacterium]
MNAWKASLVTAALAAGTIGARGEPGAFVNSAGLRLLPIPAGSFVMGETQAVPASLQGPPSGGAGDWDEHPAHRVTLTRSFFISETPLTIEAFRQFRPDFQGSGFFAPYATGLSWDDAMAYCRWLSAKEGRPYRLPTEAEWEYAARAGTATLFWSGAEPPAREAANPWGLRGIGAGIAEWCGDWHGAYPEGDLTDPLGPSSGVARVVRNDGVEVRELSAKARGAPTLGFQPSPFAAIPAYYRRSANRAGMLPPLRNEPGATAHFIGFRIVQAPPATLGAFWRPEIPFPERGILPTEDTAGLGPPAGQPYFRMRPLLPLPPEGASPEAIADAGFHPGIGGHIHSGGLAVMPNGDLLQVSFSSDLAGTESDASTVMVVTRLRRGSDQWDPPDLFYDLPDLNDQSALLWNDGGKVWFFGGGRYLGDVPFRFAASEDSGATWTPLAAPRVTRRAGFVEPQPITSAFRAPPSSTIYFGSDAQGGSSMLWASPDEGRSWFDTGGRTAGRHTAFVLLRDGRILGMGGKSTDIDGYMPRTFSADGGSSWAPREATPFSALGGNQRPTILRLRSGRLFFAGDFQSSSAKLVPPATIPERGAYVALSDDEGRTWRTKRLAMAQLHENRSGPHAYPTLGYVIAAQGANGVIYLTTSMNRPALEFEMNEAWILSAIPGEANARTDGPGAGPRESHEARYQVQRGPRRAVWSSRIGANGDYVLDGTETWYYPSGRREYQVDYVFGRKVGTETYWGLNGRVLWSWTREPDGTATWVRYWPNSRLRTKSTWRGGRAEGEAERWDPDGRLVGRTDFADGLAPRAAR